jgi:subtilisin-like proprotein convertase family protein
MKTFLKTAVSLGGLIFGVTLPDSFCGAATLTFANTNVITINDSSQPFVVVRATPYPSTIEVAGFLDSETIEKVTVTLHDLRHGCPDDIDMLLVGPGGQKVIILSDAGGGFADPDVPITITLDDGAADEVPNDGPIIGSLASGTYRPSNFEDGDIFPQPAPFQSSTTNLAGFAETYPNGTWQLYIVDDDVFDGGSISGGWSLAIQTASSPPALTGIQSNNFMTVSWPVSAAGYQLQQTTNIALTNSWSLVGPPDVTNGNQISVTVPTTALRKFFRLKSP